MNVLVGLLNTCLENKGHFHFEGLFVSFFKASHDLYICIQILLRS